MLCPLRLEIDPLPEGSPEWLIDESLVKKHCNVDFNDDNANLQVYLRAAVEWVEGYSHRTIIRREHRWILKEFPAGGRQEIRLPRGLTVSVDSITYYAGGVSRDLTGASAGSPPGSDYQEALGSDTGGVLMPPRGGSWPSVDQDVIEPVKITFVAGCPAGEIPPAYLHAILLATSDGYDMRGTADFSAQSLADNGKCLYARQSLMGQPLVRWY